jgi:hypothetical protein
MNADQSIRLQCLRLAVDQPGNSNTIPEAQKFYDFVTQGAQKTDEATKAPSEESNISKPQQSARKKGNDK